MSYEDSKIGSPWRGYYITAYGLAVKHGYKGSEQQWLASLSGEDGKEVQIRFCEETNQLEQKKEGEAVWRPLLDLSDLQTQVVAQTLSAADNAAASCRTGRFVGPKRGRERRP